MIILCHMRSIHTFLKTYANVEQVFYAEGLS